MLEIEEKTVIGVLLNDGWHVVKVESFKVDRVAIRTHASGSVHYGDAVARWQEDSPPAAPKTIAFNIPIGDKMEGIR